MIPTARTVDQLASSRRTASRCEAARRPDLPLAVVVRFADDPVAEVREAIAQRSDLPVELIAKLAKDDTLRVRLAVARRAELPAVIAAPMSQDASLLVQTAIASQPNLPHEFLMQWAASLAKDDYAVRCAIARRSDLSVALLEQLAQDPIWEVRGAIAGRVDLPTGVIGWLALDPDRYVRQTVASRDALPVALVERLALDPDLCVRRAIAQRTDLPPAVAERLAAEQAHARNVLCNQKIRECSDLLRKMGCAVIAMSPEELRGADVERVQERMLESAWAAIELEVGPPPPEGDMEPGPAP